MNSGKGATEGAAGHSEAALTGVERVAHAPVKVQGRSCDPWGCRVVLRW